MLIWLNNNFLTDISFYLKMQLETSQQKKQHNFKIRTISDSLKTIKNLINDKNNNIHIKSNVGVYIFQCLMEIKE